MFHSQQSMKQRSRNWFGGQPECRRWRRGLGAIALLTSLSLAIAPLRAQENLEDLLEDFDYWADLCNLQVEAKKYEEALAACEQGIILEPKDSGIWAEHSGVLLKLKKYPEAIASARKALSFNEENSLALTYICQSFRGMNQLEKALDACNQALKLDGSWGTQSPLLAWFYRGVLLAESGQQEQALIAFERALLLEPEDSLILAYRCGTLTDLKRYDEAIAICRQALDGNGRWGDFTAALAWSNLGFAHAQLKQYDAAIAAYDRAVSINANDPVIWGRQGLALEALGRVQEALTSYESAAALKEDYSLAQVGRCTMLNKLERHEEALAACDLALQGDGTWPDPGPVKAWDQRGIALAGQGDYEAALASANRAVGIKPDYIDAWGNRSATFWYLKRYEEALASAERAIALKPDAARAWFNKGTILRTLGNDAGALNAYDQALKGDTPLRDRAMLVNIWANRSAVLWSQGKFADALTSADEAIALNPNAAQGWFNRGIALAKLRRYSEALDAYDRALEIEPDTGYIWSAKGDVLLKLGRFEAALPALQTAAKLDPENPVVQANLAQVQQLLNAGGEQ